MAEVQAEPGAGQSGQDLVGGEDLVAATLTYLARALVEHPDDVRVGSEPGAQGTIYRLHVHDDDMGRVIGKAGRLARAIRTVTRAAAARSGVIVRIEIGDR